MKQKNTNQNTTKSKGIANSSKDKNAKTLLGFDEAIAEAFNNRGIIKYDLGDYVGAISDYNRAIEMNPKDAEVYNNLGVAGTSLK